MSINESRNATLREKWPLEFDLSGIPRDNQIREALKEQNNMAVNNFAAKTVKVSDLNNPPRVAYTHQEFPKMVYSAEGRVAIVKDEKEDKASVKKGFRAKPYPDFDYSTTLRGQAKKKDAAVALDKEEDFTNLDAEEDEAEAS